MVQSCAPCTPGSGSSNFSDNGLTPEGWCLKTERWIAQICSSFLSDEPIRSHQLCYYTGQLQTKAWHLWLVTSAGLDQCPEATLCVSYNFHLPCFTYSFFWPEHADAIRATNSYYVFNQSWLHFCVPRSGSLKLTLLENAIPKYVSTACGRTNPRIDLKL